MGVFVRAIIYGFGFSLGSALFKKYESQLGFGDDTREPSDRREQQAPEDAEVVGDDGDDGGDA